MLGVLFDGLWVPGWAPLPPMNRAGDYPAETRYVVVPHDGRYRSAGIHGVSSAHVDVVCGVVERAIVDPHCPELARQNIPHWIDCDLPTAAIAAGREALRSALWEDADTIMDRAAARAEALRAQAAAL
jgi:hypothetical protein